MKNKKGFTLLELMIVVVILGILAILGITQYLASRERALDKEAEANLRLILAAERTYRMEDEGNQYIQLDDTATVNKYLKLILPSTGSAWNYITKTNAAKDNFCAQATRTTAPVRRWKIMAPTAAAPDPAPQKGACPGVL